MPAIAVSSDGAAGGPVAGRMELIGAVPVGVRPRMRGRALGLPGGTDVDGKFPANVTFAGGLGSATGGTPSLVEWMAAFALRIDASTRDFCTTICWWMSLSSA